MEKIDYKCNASEIGLALPKRRWYENRRKERNIRIPLYTDQIKDAGVGDILLTVSENGQKEVNIHMSVEEEGRFLLAAFHHLPVKMNKLEELIVFDNKRTDLVKEILPYCRQSLNRLTVITEYPEEYEEIFEEIYRDSGLIAECMQKYDSENSVCTPSKSNRNSTKKVTPVFILHVGNSHKIPIRQLPGHAVFFDMDLTKKTEREIFVKRPDIPYYGTANFLDTIVKLRYNTLVKEGIFTEEKLRHYYKNSALRERDNSNGRKEEYLDLRRLKEI